MDGRPGTGYLTFFKMIRVLLIDDEVGFTKAMKFILEQTGNYEVAVENESQKALAKALEFLPDIIFLDVVMPEIDGGDVLILFRSEERLKNVPVILLTSMVENDETAGGLGVAEEAGQVMLAKPAKIETIVNIIERHVKAR